MSWLVGLVTAEGSTRSAALLRIALVPLIWTRFAGDWILYKDLRPERIALGLSLYLSTLAMLVGWRSRLSSAWAGATLLAFYYYVGVHAGEEEYTHHHTYILGIAPVLLALTPCGGSYSWDRWRAVQRAEREDSAPPPERGPTWGLRLIVLQISMIYLWGAISKCTAAYLSGDRFEHYYLYLYRGSDYPAWGGFEPSMMALAWASVLVEFALAIGVFARRYLWLVLPAGILFHAIIYYTLPVSTFSATMWALYLACLDPDAVHRFIDRLSGYDRRG